MSASRIHARTEPGWLGLHEGILTLTLTLTLSLAPALTLTLTLTLTPTPTLTLTLTKAGAWMADYDIVKRGAALKLENQVS